MPMPRDVPPTEMAYGSLAGVRTPELSPAEKYMPTPSAAARTSSECSILSISAGWFSGNPSHELEMIEARGAWPSPFRITVTALNSACRP